jgi:hypothetical protein
MTQTMYAHVNKRKKKDKKEQKTKGIQIRKEEVRLSLFVDYMILYPKNSNKKLLEIINSAKYQDKKLTYKNH